LSVSGILSINKPAGWTSFDVVALVRKRTGVRKVGHAGALDPSATGGLLVCLGQAVRISEYLMQLPKVYRARVMLGVATDTYDSEGQVTFEGDAGTVSDQRPAAARPRERHRSACPCGRSRRACSRTTSRSERPGNG